MHGNFSRLFDLQASDVLLFQQGRVMLDADLNALTRALTGQVRLAARDIIGAHGGPGEGFKIKVDGTVTTFQAGAYYVGGLRVEASETVSGSLKSQPFMTERDRRSLMEVVSGTLVYLEVTQRTLDSHDLVEPALHGADSAKRLATLWQVKTTNDPDLIAAIDAAEASGTAELRTAEQMPLLRPTLTGPDDTGDASACNVEQPVTGVGLGNELIRLQLHSTGTDGVVKWSRENGAVTFRVTGSPSKGTLKLTRLARDAASELKDGDLVEIVEDDDFPRVALAANTLATVDHYDRETQVISLKNPIGELPIAAQMLRRWDGWERLAAMTQPAPATASGITIAPGLNVVIDANGKLPLPGDFWLIATRLSSPIELLWKHDAAEAKYSALPPHGPLRLVAPLFERRGNKDRRRSFAPLAK